jgi:ABC-type microcin C transport system duplicated ATPase subunit YejF
MSKSPDGQVVLAIENLSVDFASRSATVTAVRGVHLQVKAGECLGLVGETGSGKTQICLAVTGLLPRQARARGSIRFLGQERLKEASPSRDSVRDPKVAMIFQDPMSSLTPHMTIGEQLAEPLRHHFGMSKAQARARVQSWLDRVRIPDVARRMRQYPHELSGGMRQRAMIAGAMACNPVLLVADEPTTALDVRVQAEILDILDELQCAAGLAVLFVSHDLGVIARIADRVCVLRGGEVQESGSTHGIFTRPQSPYTRKLIAATARVDKVGSSGQSAPAPVAPDAPVVLHAEGLSVEYSSPPSLFGRRRRHNVLRGVSLRVRRGETLALVGESGSGKSTLARAILQVLRADTARVVGSVTLLGKELAACSPSLLRAARRELQLVSQDPTGSLDPRMRIADSIAEPLRVHRPEWDESECARRVALMLSRVGLDPAMGQRFPRQLSGGQNQRVSIARAMILEPQLVICDEAVTALDVCVRAEVLALLVELQRRLGTAIVFISHDLAVVRQIAHRVQVLHEGATVEEGTADEILGRPVHPYTRALLSAVLPPEPPGVRP